MDYFTADPHFGHANIIKYCKRPYDTVEEMDAKILAAWNERFKPGDRLFILGDFCGQRRSAEVIRGYLDRIALKRGAVMLIGGNHDNKQGCRKVFGDNYRHHEYYTYTHPGTKQKIVLCHYAMRVWNGSHRGVWHLYGHSHGNLEDDPFSYSFDCGVDGKIIWSFPEVVERMKTKSFRPVDHHK